MITPAKLILTIEAKEILRPVNVLNINFQFGEKKFGTQREFIQADKESVSFEIRKEVEKILLEQLG